MPNWSPFRPNTSFNVKPPVTAKPYLSAGWPKQSPAHPPGLPPALLMPV